MGCGRVGSGLAKELESAGHTVAVIDQNREAFRRLGPNFQGTTLTGVGFDRDILIQSGIERADARLFGQRANQDAIFEVDADEVRLVSCTSDEVEAWPRRPVPDNQPHLPLDSSPS